MVQAPERWVVSVANFLGLGPRPHLDRGVSGKQWAHLDSIVASVKAVLRSTKCIGAGGMANVCVLCIFIFRSYEFNSLCFSRLSFISTFKIPTIKALILHANFS